MPQEVLTDWLGRCDERLDVAGLEPLSSLAALLDHDRPPWPVGCAPPLGHWLYFLPNAPLRDLGEDGRPRRGGLQRPSGAWQRSLAPDPVLLFRYSALTFNGHRIHYDRSYCQQVEAYPGLVVHGPLTATLLMDLFLRHAPGRNVSRFCFRAHRPLFGGQPLALHATPTPTGATLWAGDSAGCVAMTAEVTALTGEGAALQTAAPKAA